MGRPPTAGHGWPDHTGDGGRRDATTQPGADRPADSTQDATEDTAKVPAASLGAIVAAEQAAAAHGDGRPDRRPLSTAARRQYAEKMRSIADVDTERLLAPSVERTGRARPAAPWQPAWRSTARSAWQSPWLRRVALVVALALLALRAGIASAAFMAPGGGIIGWSVVPHTTSPFQVTPPVTQQHPLTPSEYAALLVGQLNLDQELGQMMIVQLRGINPGPDEDTMVASQGAGGVLYFAYNIQSASQVRASTAHVQQEAPIPVLLSVDQEGGPVNRFKAIVGPLPAAADLTSPDQARARGQQDAGILHDNGFNLNLAPVVDVGTANPQLAGRTFGSDPQRVATMAGAYLSGLQADGTVTGTVKHFPGLGATTTDPHRGLPVLNRSRADWEAIDLLPYRTMLKTEDVRAIMVTHVMIPTVDQDLPSSLSPAIVDGTLRQELGFQGVVITDDVFHMAALSSRYPGPQAAVLAVKAGSDEIIGPANPTEVRETKDALTQAISSGELTKDRIDLSVQRILTLKIEMGLIPLPKATSTPTATPAHSPTPTPRPHAGVDPIANRSPGAAPSSS